MYESFGRGIGENAVQTVDRILKKCQKQVFEILLVEGAYLAGQRLIV
jgi:hypothetical protein